MQMIADRLLAAGRCAIIAHVTPDGDTLGSVFALSLALDQMGVENSVYCSDALPHTYAFLPGADKLLPPPETLPSYPIAVSVDVSDYGRLGRCAAIFDTADEAIVLDHHMTNPGFGDTNIISKYAASAQVVLELIDALGAELTRDIAVNLFVALSTDTGNFNYNNTCGPALRAAARLVETGIDIASITRRLYRMRTPSKTLLIGRGINGMRFEMEGKVAVMCLTPEDYRASGADDSETEGIINYAIECEGVQVALLAREDNSEIKISLRSTGEYDVGTLAGELGGGGHATASGVTLPGPLNRAVQRVLAAVRTMMTP